MDHLSIHAKIREFESRIRKWKQLRFGLSDAHNLIPPPRRSNSNEPRSRYFVNNIAPPNGNLPGAISAQSTPRRPPLNAGCVTSPLPRKNMDRNLGLGLGLDLGNQQMMYSDPQQEELERRIQEIQLRSGILRIQGVERKVALEELEFVADIGHGSCGHVSKWMYKGQVMAVKQMARTQNPVEGKRIIMDLDVVMRSFDCEHIVRCYGYFITDTEVKVCMELMATCLDRMLRRTDYRPVPEPVIGKMAVSIISALDYLKDRHAIIHRDVKPSNILLDWNGVVKLCDFGISGKLIESRAHTRTAGCPPYMAPERFDVGGEGSTDYDIRSDVWSVGITLVELARGKYPYSHCKSEFEILTEIMQKPSPSLRVEEGFSEQFCHFVSLCLSKEVEKRPKYKELLAHPFITVNREMDTDVAEWFSDIMEC